MRIKVGPRFDSSWVLAIFFPHAPFLCYATDETINIFTYELNLCGVNFNCFCSNVKMFSFIVNRRWCSIVVSSLFKVREIIAKGSVSIGHKCGCKAV